MKSCMSFRLFNNVCLVGQGKLRRLIMESAHIDHQPYQMTHIYQRSPLRFGMIVTMHRSCHYANGLKSTAPDLQSP